MSVLIKGMKIPKSCSNCLFFVDGLYDANDEPCSACLAKENNSPSGCGHGEIDGIDHTTRRMHWCPLVEVSEPHGDLIDRQRFLRELSYIGDRPTSTGIRYAKEIPAVIEAEGE